MEGNTNMNMNMKIAEEIEREFDKMMERGYDYYTLALWAENHVPVLLSLLREESELADMYRGLCK